LRVAIATSFPEDPAQPHGGVEAVSVNLVRALAKLEDLEIHVVTTDRRCASPSKSGWEGAIVHRLPWRGRRVLTHVLGPGRRDVRAYLASLEPDLIHAHDIYGLMVKGMPYPRVFTIHGFIHADTLIAGGRLARVRSRIWRWAETAGWADQPHIVSISPYVRERLNGIATGVIHDIENPIAEECFHIARDERKGTIFSAALICPRKNTLSLVQALARLVSAGLDAELRLAGRTTDPQYAQQIRRFVQEQHLADRVHLLGPIRADRVRAELARASVFALVSLEEGAPMGVAEAMAAGVPVVTSNRCGMPYMVRDGESGYLVDPADAEEIAGRLRQLLEDDTLRARMGEAARRFALDRFHPDRVAWRTREVYRRAVWDHERSAGKRRN